MKIKTKLEDSDFHPHLKARMLQRGITKEDIEKTLSEGWQADNSKPGTLGKVLVLTYKDNWEGE